MQHPASSSSRNVLIGVAIFALLSIADLYLTWLLLQSRGEEVIESNPLAARILTQFGWAGLTAFKLAAVAFISGIAYVLSQRRPRAGDLLLIFGCGAQTAIVMGSVFLYTSESETMCVVTAGRGPTESLPSLPPEGLRLLAMPSVQAELKLTDDQIQFAKDLDQYRRDLRRGMRHANLEDAVSEFQQLVGTERALASDLTAVQMNRLRQLARQFRGPQALTDYEMRVALHLSNEQSDAVAQILEKHERTPYSERGRKVLPPSALPADDAQKATGQIASVLSATQMARWQELQGAPFTFDERLSVSANLPSTTAAE